jgi:hypothetical protein
MEEDNYFTSPLLPNTMAFRAEASTCSTLTDTL